MDIEEKRAKDRAKAKRWRAANPERHRESVKAWNKRNPDSIKGRRKKVNSKLKLETIAAYGGECACCGEIQPEFLTLDHANHDGKEHRKSLGGWGGIIMYRKLRQDGFPQNLGLRILCFNCNCSLGIFGYCPHQRI